MFLVTTQFSVTDRISDLLTSHLYENIHAAHVTIDCMAGSQEYTGVDSAIRFNAMCWADYSDGLCYYAARMCEEYVRRKDASTSRRGEIEQVGLEVMWAAQRSSLEELSSLALQPSWAANTEVLNAHRAYLCSRDTHYYTLWPDLRNEPARVIPVPNTGLHAYQV